MTNWDNPQQNADNSICNLRKRSCAQQVAGQPIWETLGCGFLESSWGSMTSVIQVISPTSDWSATDDKLVARQHRRCATCSELTSSSPIAMYSLKPVLFWSKKWPIDHTCLIFQLATQPVLLGNFRNHPQSATSSSPYPQEMLINCGPQKLKLAHTLILLMSYWSQKNSLKWNGSRLLPFLLL